MTDADPTTLTAYDECYTDLRTCREQFESIRADVDALVAPLTERQLLWRPPGEAWSIAECIAHLVDLANHSLGRVLEAHALALAVELRSRGPLRPHLNSREFVPLFMPAQRPFTRLTRPVVTEAAAILSAFRLVNDRTLSLIDRASSGVTRRPPRAIALIAGIGHGLQLAALQHWRFILEARRVTERPGFPQN